MVYPYNNKETRNKPNELPHIIAAEKKTAEFGNIHRYILFRPKGHLCSLHAPGLSSLIDYCICLWDILGTNI
jgi:hypothetical protein